ncbi:hypothetical protein ABB37_01432 [Leptomonas pyrrhocoris]|uniref:Uncharacterized protein n=1 Tax=Leptomonas pyrrhocoris TaxID=157538 RepID=A0A0M9G903_LEPPY|nr:hypothetical protein ABB37_01432 [Leptomonas pyrrhocoris]KPA84999.1 hypothetical protein ABB37_01432 [Leptomonas pyrrhocoris]|eukprot:XP_015663438.1 hypothetical protein ABB37_01432 [Leptomonas pyrrhocoris]
MRASRVMLSQGKAAKAYALDLEFVKCKGSVYARSAAFVPFRRITTAQATAGSESAVQTNATQQNKGGGTADDAPTRLTELLDKPIVLELKPDVTLSLAESLPCGHLLREMIDVRFAPTPALTAVVREFHETARNELSAHRDLLKTQRKQKKDEKIEREREEERAGGAAGDAPDCSSGTVDTDDFINVEEDHDASLLSSPTAFSSSSSLKTTRLTSSAEAMASRSLQMRDGLTHNFRGLDPYGIPNVRIFEREALKTLYAAPVESRDFKAAAKQLRCLLHAGRGKNGYKPLAFCTRTYPEFLQKVLQAVFESPSAWYEWLTACYTRVEEDLRGVREARGAVGTGESITTPITQAAVFVECNTLEELATRMNLVWGGLLREGEVRGGGDREDSTRGEGSGTAPPKVFVYGNADLRVIHNTLGLSKSVPPLNLHLSVRGSKVRRFLTHRSSKSPTSSSSSSAEAGKTDESTPNSDVQLISPYEARVVDITKHPLFTASGFALSSNKTPSLSVALEKAAVRDATAAALHGAPRQHDALWDAQALACLCSVSGAVR